MTWQVTLCQRYQKVLCVCVMIFWNLDVCMILALLWMTPWETSCICMHVWSMSSQTTSLGMACYFFQMYADRVMTRLIRNLKCAVVSTVHNMYSLKSQHFDIFCNYDHLIAYPQSSTRVWHAADTDNIVGQNRVKCTCHFQNYKLAV